MTGEDVLNSRGQLFSLTLVSPSEIDLTAYMGVESFVFVVDTYILCIGAIAQVREWDHDVSTIVETLTSIS